MGRVGKLKFKGEAKKKSKKSSKHKLSSPDANQSTSTESITQNQQQQKQQHHEALSYAGGASVARGGDSGTSNSDNNNESAIATSHNKNPQISEGQGFITTSSTVVTGHNTAFKTQLHVGDAILTQTTKGEEMRIVKMVLSPISISISSAFSSDLKTPTAFKYINKPRDDAREKAAKVAKARLEQEEVEQRAMGTYGNKKGEIVYRERTEHGSYRIKREQATTDLSRSDLLAVRAKKKSDRYC
ncbi:hypothetical protein ACHAWC_009530 [Mediolabrus comicus]